MKTISVILFSFLFCGTLWAAPAGGALTVSVVPTSPILIPYGSGTTVGGYFKLTAPYFILNSINLNWSGAGSIILAGIEVTSPMTFYDANLSVACGYGGDDLSYMFPANVGSDDQVHISSGESLVSKPLGCGNVGLPIPAPSSFSIPVTVSVWGVTVDASGNATGQVTATAQITVQ